MYDHGVGLRFMFEKGFQGHGSYASLLRVHGPIYRLYDIKCICIVRSVPPLHSGVMCL